MNSIIMLGFKTIMQSSLKFFIDSDEVLYGRHTFGAIDNFHGRLTFKWIINIGGS